MGLNEPSSQRSNYREALTVHATALYSNKPGRIVGKATRSMCNLYKVEVFTCGS